MHRSGLIAGLAACLVAASLALSAQPASAASTYYVSPTGSGSTCSSSSPCGTFEAALGKARPGDTVLVRSGSYPLQEIDRSVSWGGNDANIEFRPQSGSVTIGGIRSHVPSLTFSGFNVTGVMYFHADAHANEALSNRIEQAFVTGADDTVWKWNTIRPNEYGPDAMQVKGANGDNPVGVTIIGNIFGPQLLKGNSHTDCLQILGGDDVYVARNVFFPCADKSIQIRSGAGGTVGSVLVESNFISECAPRRALCNGYHAVVVSAEGNDIRFVHNSINGSVGLSSGSTANGDDRLRFYGNIAASLPCTPYSDYNLVASSRCGSHDQVGTPSWVDRSETVQNLHLIAGSKGIGAGSPYAPAVDIDGQSGCAGGDLGADQRCGATTGSNELRNAVSWLYASGITTKGPDVGTFEHTATTTRAHTVTFLFRTYGEPRERGALLSDVAAGRWYTAPVQWATAVGAVTGFPNGTFKPDSPISRGDFALVLWRAAGKPSSRSTPIVDVDPGSYFGDAISWAKSVGVMNGFTDGTFRPNDAIIRGHVALMLCRFSNEVELPIGSCG